MKVYPKHSLIPPPPPPCLYCPILAGLSWLCVTNTVWVRAHLPPGGQDPVLGDTAGVVGAVPIPCPHWQVRILWELAVGQVI